jgi:dTDP-4-amino-4,6-dideoxygalactose transaminase
MPSFTFVSTANAFVLRGAVPVFVDIRPDTLNINEKLIETAITKRTRAIMVVHYAGVACDMDAIGKIAKKHNLVVVEDAAQGFMSTYKGKHLGTIGDLAAYSFHETKNIISGEGGALIINKEKYIERAEIIREKGTDRSRFFRGQVDKYSWVDIGSSYLPSEIVAAFLRAQLENAEKITRIRVKKWNTYHTLLAPLAKSGYLVQPTVPKDCVHNGHLYYILLNDLDTRTRLINGLKEKGIMGVFHYIPLHSSPAGVKYCKTSGRLPVTDKVSDTLLRLPLFYDLTDDNQQMICREIAAFFGSNL